MGVLDSYEPGRAGVKGGGGMRSNGDICTIFIHVGGWRLVVVFRHKGNYQRSYTGVSLSSLRRAQRAQLRLVGLESKAAGV